MEESITPGQNGLPLRRELSQYTPEEKALIVAAAAEVGTHVVAEAYGFAWQTISSWKRFYGKESEFNTMSKKKNKAKTTGEAKSKSTPQGNVPVTPVTPVAPAMSVAKLIIQSPSGQEITPEDVRAKVSSAVGTVDRAYIRADEGKAYWVRGEGDKEEHGAVDLW